MLISCQINGFPRDWFLADTGAAYTVIKPDVVDEINLDIANPLRYQQISSLHQTDRVPVVRLDQMQVGYYSVTGLEALVMELPHTLRIDGLLGVNFLGRFGASFEFDSATLILRARPSR